MTTTTAVSRRGRRGRAFPRRSAATARANRRRSARSSGSSPDGAGAIAFDGEDISNRPTYEIVRRGLGYVPEDRRIFSDLTVEENLRVGRQPPRPNALRLDAGAALRHLPELARVAGARWRPHVGRGAADAHHRAHADGQSLPFFMLDEPSAMASPPALSSR